MKVATETITKRGAQPFHFHAFFVRQKTRSKMKKKNVRGKSIKCYLCSMDILDGAAMNDEIVWDRYIPGKMRWRRTDMKTAKN